MPAQKTPWFVAERSEALAGLLLTSRKDILVRNEQKQEDGVDFLLAVTEGEPLPTRLFVVQVKGIVSSDQNNWMETVLHDFQPRTNTVYLPVCVFVVNVRDNRTAYAWAAEPYVEGQQAKLRFPIAPKFQELSPGSVDEIVNRVKAWYDVLPRHLIPTDD